MNLWGQTKDGQDVHAIVLKNNKGMEVKILTLGATIQSILVKDAQGVLRDVALGYDTPAEYQDGGCYFGAAVGRNANRIANAQLVLDGEVVSLAQNDGVNNLHSGLVGVDSKIWNVETESESAVTLSVVSLDGEQGFPGNMKILVTYTLSDENVLALEYEATSDKTTIANFTNHTYFNLDGHDSGSVAKQQIALFAECYTPVIDSAAIPTGELAPVEDTPMDLRVMKCIGESIDDDFEQLKFVGGYDHNWALDYDGTLQLAARAQGAVSGIQVECYTDCPGIQFYTGNFINDNPGKGGAVYGKRTGFCLETQYFPNSANQENFVKPVLKAGDVYKSRTEYHFSAKN